MALNHERRVAALEQVTEPGMPWVRIVQSVGQSRPEAIAAYEGEHGSIAGCNIILRELQAPIGEVISTTIN